MVSRPSPATDHNIPEQSRTPLTSGSLPRSALSVENLLDASPDGLLFAAENGEIQVVNRRLEEMFGYDAGGLLGLPVEVLLPAAAQARHVGHRAGYHADPRVRPMGVGRHLVGVCADGTELPVEISLSPVVHVAGRGVVATVRDDTARRAATADATAAAVAADEVRIAQTLVDTIVAGLFSTGLTLHGTLEMCDQRTRRRVEDALRQIDDLIRQMREVIFDINPRQGQP